MFMCDTLAREMVTMRSGIRANQTVIDNITYKLYLDYSIKMNMLSFIQIVKH